MQGDIVVLFYQILCKSLNKKLWLFDIKQNYQWRRKYQKAFHKIWLKSICHVCQKNVYFQCSFVKWYVMFRNGLCINNVQSWCNLFHFHLNIISNLNISDNTHLCLSKVLLHLLWLDSYIIPILVFKEIITGREYSARLFTFK